jgi:hypothetical protein
MVLHTTLSLMAKNSSSIILWNVYTNLKIAYWQVNALCNLELINQNENYHYGYYYIVSNFR